MNRQPTPEKLRIYLESLVVSGQLSPGDRLPTLRQLAAQFGLTVSTARRVLLGLCAEGMFSMRHGAGIFVNERANETAANGEQFLTVVNWYTETQLNYCGCATAGLIAEAEQAGWQVRLHSVSYAFKVSDPVFFPSSIWDGRAVILIGTYDRCRMKNFIPRKPCVAIEMHDSWNGALSTVTVDPFVSANLAVEFFRERGVRRVTVVETDTPAMQCRAELFRLAWSRHGGDCRTVLEYGDLPLALPEADEGIFFAGGTSHEYHVLALRKQFGSRADFLPNLLSVDGKSLLNPYYQPVNTIYIDWRQAAEAAFTEAVRRVSFPGTAARRIYLEPKLHLAAKRETGKKLVADFL